MLSKNIGVPTTITESRSQTNIVVVAATLDYTQSSSRTTPYVEIYSGRNSIMETPADFIQKAAEDDKDKIS